VVAHSPWYVASPSQLQPPVDWSKDQPSGQGDAEHGNLPVMQVKP
jgi:hypothetical protein